MHLSLDSENLRAKVEASDISGAVPASNIPYGASRFPAVPCGFLRFVAVP